MPQTLKVLIVDDTVTYRKIVSDALRDVPGVEVVGTAVNGKIGLEKIAELKPDCITLDFEMPEMNGLEVLDAIQARGLRVGAIMLSAFTSEGAQATTSALRKGAFDFVLKPSGSDAEANLKQLRHDLSLKLEAFARSRAGSPHQTVVSAPPATPMPRRNKSCDLVLIGISTGGPEALSRMLPALPADLAAPVVIVQHMPPLFTKSLADDLNRRCQLHVCEAAEGQLLAPGQVLIAPGGRQMKLVEEHGELKVRLTDDPPENSCRPAVDYLFRSAALLSGDSTLAVIMTGMGNDGALGCRLLKRQGATIMAQDKESCVVFGMPAFPIQDGIVDIIAPLGEIAVHITQLAGRRVALCK